MHPTRPLDTTEAAWREPLRVLRAMTPEQRLQLGFKLSRLAIRLRFSAAYPHEPQPEP